MSTSRFGAVLRIASVLLPILTLVWIASALATGFGAGLHLITARAAHTATAQFDGSLLIAGGTTDRGAARAVEVFDLVSGKSTPGPRLFEGRSDHSAVGLADGRVLLAGGRNVDGLLLASTEIYDTATDTLALGALLRGPLVGLTEEELLDIV